MSRVEIESFLKSFLLFFSSLGILIAILFNINYNKDIQTLDEKLFSQMRLCSYDLKCDNFEIDFLDQGSQELYRLYKDKKGLSSYYPIPKSEKFIMSLNFSSEKYQQKLTKLKKSAVINFLIVLGIIFLLSILFSIYALSPLRNALLLTQEFIKDILHDFNTPLASLRLNSSMLKKEIGKNEKIERIETSVENILNLQNHLRSYLQNHSLQKEEFDLKTLLLEQVYDIQKSHPDITFTVDTQKQTLFTSREAFSRVLINILSNAAKYNRPNGFVKITYKGNTLHVEDSGKGIKNPKRIFERFYKEQTRGIGIGLHIVKKLCDELHIKIGVKSSVGDGTTFMLNLSKII